MFSCSMLRLPFHRFPYGTDNMSLLWCLSILLMLLRVSFLITAFQHHLCQITRCKICLFVNCSNVYFFIALPHSFFVTPFVYLKCHPHLCFFGFEPLSSLLIISFVRFKSPIFKPRTVTGYKAGRAAYMGIEYLVSRFGI